MRALALLVLAGCAQASSNAVGPSCPGQETAPPALPASAMAEAACTLGQAERRTHEQADAIPLTEDAALAGEDTSSVAEQASLVKAALEADRIGNYPSCIQYEKKALAITDNARARLHLAACERRALKMVDALKDSQTALEIGLEQKDAAVTKLAHRRVRELLEIVPHIRFVNPPGTEIRTLTFDDKEVRQEHLAKTFSIDPGRHVLALEGTESGRVFQRTCTVDIVEATVTPVLLSAR